jgi:hypothetical protein
MMQRSTMANAPTNRPPDSSSRHLDPAQEYQLWLKTPLGQPSQVFSDAVVKDKPGKFYYNEHVLRTRSAGVRCTAINEAGANLCE